MDYFSKFGYRRLPGKTTLLAGMFLVLAGCVHSGNQQRAGMGPDARECGFSPPLSVHCGRTPTTNIDQNGRLWAAYVVGEYVYVSHSDNMGKTFSQAVQVNRQPEKVYTNGENRAKIAFGSDGEMYVSWTQETEGAFNGDIRFSRSLDGGRTFEPVKTINDDGILTSHRFDTLFVTSDGDVFIAWLDKRDQVAAETSGVEYTGAALYYTVSSDAGRTFAPNRKVADYSCECCRIAMAETPEKDVAVFWRHIFGENLHIRDHGFAVIGKNNVITPLQWATRDNWELEGCPHHGPSMTSAGDGSYHISWFTLGDARKGIFYGRYHPGTGQIDNLSTMATTGTSHPYIARIGSDLMMVWKQFDGDKTNIRLTLSNDDGNTWQPETTLVSTGGASDHPLLITYKGSAWLSWHTSDEGLRIIDLNHNQQVSER